MHLFGFIIRIYHDARSPERQFITMHGHLSINLSRCTVTWTLIYHDARSPERQMHTAVSVSTTWRHKGEGVAKVQLHSLAISALDEGEWLTSRPDHLSPVSIEYLTGWGAETVWTRWPHRDSKPRTVQHVPSLSSTTLLEPMVMQYGTFLWYMLILIKT